MKKFPKANIAFFIASCVFSMSVNVAVAEEFDDNHVYHGGGSYNGDGNGHYEGEERGDKDNNNNKTKLFSSLTLPKACLPEKGRMFGQPETSDCYCPPVSFCTKKLDDKINTLPEYIQEICCPAPEPEPICTKEQYYDPIDKICKTIPITPPPVCPPPPPKDSRCKPNEVHVESTYSGVGPDEGTGYYCIPAPPGCGTNPIIAPYKKITLPLKCEVHYYDHTAISNGQKTQIGTRAAEYCTRYAYTKNGSLINLNEIVLPNPSNKTEDALDALNECLNSKDVDGYRKSIRDSLVMSNSNRLKYIGETNTWIREWSEMEQQLDLKNYLEARKDCFEKTGFSEKKFVTYGGIGSYQNLIPDNEKKFNEWAMLNLNDNVSDITISNSTGRKEKRGPLGIIVTQSDDRNDEVRALVKKYDKYILKPHSVFSLIDYWWSTKTYIAKRYNLWGENDQVQKFKAKIYGPLEHATVNQKDGTFQKFFDNTYDPSQIIKSMGKQDFLEPSPTMMPSYSYTLNDIDRMLGEIPNWYNTKDGWRIIRGIKRAIAKTGADGYFYKNLTDLSDADKFKNLDEILPDHKKKPYMLSFNTPIYSFTKNGDKWGVHCSDVKYVGICITTFTQDTSGETCLAPETKITMSSGETKLINEVKEGDIVESENGKDAVVESVTELDWEKRNLYSINNGQLRLTADHPIMTKSGWRAIDYHVRNDNNEQKRYGLKDVKPLEIGDVMITENGEIPVTRIMPEAPIEGGKTFNLKLKYNIKSFYANGILVRSQK